MNAGRSEAAYRRASTRDAMLRRGIRIGVWLLCLGWLGLFPAMARAACPTSITVPANGGSYGFSSVACMSDHAGTNSNPIVQNGAHGNVTVTSDDEITYTSNAGTTTGTTDSFIWLDADNVLHTVSVTLGSTTSPLTITTTSLSNAAVGQSYSVAIQATGGTGTGYVFKIEQGVLPNGITESSTGVLSGTPSESGSFTFTQTVTDSASTSAQQSLTLVVTGGVLTVNTTSLPKAYADENYSVAISVSGGVGPYTFTQVPGTAPPAGITIGGSGLSGTATTTGTTNFSVEVSDSASHSTQVSYSLVVDAPPITVTPSISRAPGGTVGSAYPTVTLSASGGQSPYAYSATNLPPGLTLSSAGTLGGTPSTAGTYNVVFTAADAHSYTGQSSIYAITIAPQLSWSNTTLANGTVGTSYSSGVSATGGATPYSYALTSGTLPTGLTLNSASGAITGTPTEGGNFSLVMAVTDANGATLSSGALTLSIAAPVLSVSPASGPLPNATEGTAYTQTLLTNGSATGFTYQATSGALPPGMSISGNTLTGTPTTHGTFSFTITSTDNGTNNGSGNPYTTTANYSLDVILAAPVIATTSLPNGTVGATYASTAINATGGTAPYSFSVSSGTLPPGLQLNGGTLEGTPSAGGTYTFAVQATDRNGSTSAAQTYTITIGSPTLSLTPGAGALAAANAESSYTQTFSTTGGTPSYTYTISSGALPPGLSLSASGTLSGTPTVAGSYAFSVRSMDHSTGAGAPFSITQSYSLQVNAPGVALSPGMLSNAQVAVPYNQQLSASGGNGNYTFNVSAGSLPPGLTLSTSGLLSGTPSAAGNYSFTITAKDSLNFSGSQAYTISTQQQKPVAVNDPATTQANQAVTIHVTSVDTGVITGIAVSSGPSHGTATISGLAIVYAPAQDYYGTDTLAYTATGPGGTSAPATVTITVTPLATPTVTSQSVTVLAGNTISINPSTGATGGPFTAISIAKAPASGTAAVSGNTINYSANANASGQDTFTYTLANAFGVSQPGTVTVTIDPRPLAAAQSVSLIAGGAVQVDLGSGASGGPFTGAALVSLSPASAGSARIVAASGGYQLDFTASPTFSGAAVATYTLSNAYATSALGTITIAVTARPDPSRDTEVLGMLGAQANATRAFAQGQIQNFQERLESLHDGGGGGGIFQNNLAFTSDNGYSAGMSPQWLDLSRNMAGNLNRRYLVDPRTPANPAGTSSSALPDGYVLWTGGAVNFGSRNTTATANGFDFTTAGVSLGIDRRFSPSFAMGLGAGYGHDDTDIGQNGSNDTADSYNLAWYASFSPSPTTFIDGLIGYQWLSFDARRYVTADGNTVTGSRDGHQAFASISAGYEYHRDTWLVSPYGRFDIATARLARYTEQGDAIYALSYGSEQVKTTTASLGLRVNYVIKEDYGTVMPQLRIEYGHDFEGSSQATMTYADLLAGPIYRAPAGSLTQNHFLIGIGINWELARQLALRLEYGNEISAGGQNDQSVLINVQKKF